MTSCVRLLPVAAFGLAALLSGCGDTSSGTTPAQTARATSAAMPPAAVGTRFDGRYVGTGTLTVSRGSVCGPQSMPRSITVVNGNATFVIDQNRGASASGAIQADGSVSMASQQEATTVTGRFQGGAFNGEMRGTACTRTLQLRRGGAPAA